VPNMPSWKAKKLRKLPQEKVLLERCRRLTNSIRPLSVHKIRGAILPVRHAQKLSPQINVELVVCQEVFGQYADRMVSPPPVVGMDHHDRAYWEWKRSGSIARMERLKAGPMHKKLDSPGLTPYHTPRPGGARSLGAAGATEGPARQLWPATLAGPPSMRRTLMVASHYSIFPAQYVTSFLVSSPSMIASSPMQRTSTCR
jgi:hypothetical protein